MAELLDTLPGPPIQQHGRTHNSAWSGMEIVRKFHVPSWSDFHSVQRELHGRVEEKVKDFWTRTPPLRDTYIKNCYCNETQVDFAHPNSPKTIPSLSSDGATSIKELLENQAETLQKGTAGAIITAHYRPLITAWKPETTGEENPDPEEKKWDWLDPIFSPGVMQLPWPAGLHAAVDSPRFKTRDVPVEASQPLAVPVIDFSIKRILVGIPPWGPIAQLANVINSDPWPDGDLKPAARGLGFQFPARTLKFVDADVTNMIDAEGNRWYEVILNFKWVHLVTSRLFDKNGKLTSGPVTWDHMFMRPNGFTTGWYEVFRSGTRNLFGFNIDFLWPGEDLEEGNLHIHGKFDNLFVLDQPLANPF